MAPANCPASRVGRRDSTLAAILARVFKLDQAASPAGGRLSGPGSREAGGYSVITQGAGEVTWKGGAAISRATGERAEIVRFWLVRRPASQNLTISAGTLFMPAP